MKEVDFDDDFKRLLDSREDEFFVWKAEVAFDQATQANLSNMLMAAIEIMRKRGYGVTVDVKMPEPDKIETCSVRQRVDEFFERMINDRESSRRCGQDPCRLQMQGPLG